MAVIVSINLYEANLLDLDKIYGPYVDCLDTAIILTYIVVRARLKMIDPTCYLDLKLS